MNSATVVSLAINCSILSVKVSGKPVGERVKYSDKEKDDFRLVTSVGQRKKFVVPMSNRTSDLRIPRSDVLPLSHRDSTVSEVYFEFHMTSVLHTVWISNVDSVIVVNKIREIGKF